MRDIGVVETLILIAMVALVVLGVVQCTGFNKRNAKEKENCVRGHVECVCFGEVPAEKYVCDEKSPEATPR